VCNTGKKVKKKQKTKQKKNTIRVMVIIKPDQINKQKIEVHITVVCVPYNNKK